MKQECSNCGTTDDWLYLHGRCHITSATWCRVKGNVIEIVCAECGKFIESFEIKDPKITKEELENNII